MLTLEKEGVSPKLLKRADNSGALIAEAISIEMRDNKLLVYAEKMQ